MSLNGDEHDECYWCGMPLAARHEHDHVPPKRHDGRQMVPTCMNCHEMKDRTPLKDWPLQVLMDAFASIPQGKGRLLAGKLHAIAMDMDADLAKMEESGKALWPVE